MDCCECKKDFNSNSELQAHLRVHALEISNYKVPVDVEVFNYRMNCDACDKRLWTDPQFEDHEIGVGCDSEQRKKTTFHCDYCMTRFKSRDSFKQHVFTHCNGKRKGTGDHDKNKDPEVNKCDICGNVFRYGIALKCHRQRKHPVNLQNQCNICEKVLKTKANLKRHLTEVHVGKRPYKCKDCDKAFKSRFHLKQHQVMHSEERPYKCSICDKAFKVKRILKKHQLVHSSDRPHKCETCQKTFKTKTHLKIHKVTHSSDRPHKWNICEESFKRKTNLVKHEKTVHQNTASK